MDIRQTLINVLNTLNQVDVKGRQNLDRMLSSLIAIEKVVRELDAKQERQKEAGEIELK